MTKYHFGQNILQSTTVYEIFNKLLMFWNSNFTNSSLTCNLSLWKLSSKKCDTVAKANLAFLELKMPRGINSSSV